MKICNWLYSPPASETRLRAELHGGNKVGHRISGIFCRKINQVTVFMTQKYCQFLPAVFWRIIATAAGLHTHRSAN